MRKIFLAVTAVMCVGGCSLLSDVDSISEKAAPPVVIVAESMAKAEPVISALEATTGKTINPVVAAKGEIVANKVNAVSKTGAGIATALGQPGIGALLAGLAALAGGVGSFFHRRRAKNIAKAATRAANLSEGGGKKLMAEAARLGVADVVNLVHRKEKE